MNNTHKEIDVKRIETLLLEEQSVEGCVVQVQKTENAEYQLVAYVVSKGPFVPEQVHAHLQTKLPENKLPSAYIPLSTLPLTDQGQLDEVALARLGETKSVFIPPKRAISHGGMLEKKTDAPSCLSEILQRAALTEKGVIYIQPDGSEHFQSYKHLLEEAMRIMTGLTELGLKTQDKIIFQIDKGQDFVPAFWGCVLGGFIPVPLSIAPTYQHINSDINKLYNAWQMLEYPLVLTSTHLADNVRSLSTLLKINAFQVEAVDNLRVIEPERHIHQSQPDDLALLLLTSGSTGLPKAVMLTHHNLLSMSAGTVQMNDFSSQEVTLNWMPLDHVGAIIMLGIMPTDLACQQIQVPTQFILQNPLRWLDLIQHHQASISWAPNFAFSLINERVEEINQRTWDLSTMRFLINGGEQIVAKTARYFLKLFCQHGLPSYALRPAFGMSETSSAITFSASFSVENSSDDMSFVEVGHPIPGVSLRIVDENNQIVTAGTIGRLQVKGYPVTSGYYQNPERNQEVFSKDNWFTTGDMGYLQNGGLALTGREKNDIIINGINYLSHEIESVVEEIEHVEVSYTAACAVRIPDDNSDRLAIFFVTSGEQNPHFLKKLINQIQWQVFKNVGVNPHYIIPVTKETIPKTAIGKIQRAQLKKRFEAGEFDAIQQFGNADEQIIVPTNETKPQRRLREQIQTNLLTMAEALLKRGEHQIDLNAKITQYGFDSIRFLMFAHQINERYHLEITPSIFFEYTSIASLSEFLCDKSQENLRCEYEQDRLEIVTTEAPDVYPLSFGQKALWLLYQLAPESPAYNIALTLRIRSTLDVPTLQNTFQALINRHSCLRTTFVTSDSEPLQKIHQYHLVRFEHIDASTWSLDELNQQIVKAYQKPFNLEQGPVLRVNLLTLAQQEHVLLLTIHHIVFDGWSLWMLIKELGELYPILKAGGQADLPSLKYTYADYVHWQSNMLASRQGEHLWTYWQQQLAGELPVLNLPTDHHRPPVQTYQGACVHFFLTEALTGQLKELALTEDVSLYMILLATYQILLHRYTGQEDILVGSPTTTRTQPEFADILGYFVNMVVLRAVMKGELTFKAFLGQVRQTVLGALDHQDYPFPLLVEHLQPNRDPSYSPLCQVIFTYQKPLPRLEQFIDLFIPGETGIRVNVGGLEMEAFELGQQEGAFDLTLEITEVTNALVGTFKYNTDLFEQATITRMVGHFQTLLEGIVANPLQAIHALPLLTEAEQQQFLSWNDTATDYPREKTIVDLFEEQVERTPEAIAVVFEEQQLTYRALNKKANQLAHYLQTLGVKPEVLVGICLERSLEMVIGLLGIFKVGGAYLPLDPTYPKARLAFMLEDAGVPVLLSQTSLKEGLPETTAHLVCLDAEAETLAQQSAENLKSGVGPANLAYVIYTSGSTGQPKGVLIAHQGLCNLATAQIQLFEVQSNSKILQFASLSFDASIWEIVMSMSSGAQLCLANSDNLLPGPTLLQLLRQYAITHVTLPPTALAVLPIEDGLDLQYLIVAGENCSPELAAGWSKDQRFFNAYGPTEGTVCASVFENTAGSASTLPIGGPIANIQTYILDPYLQWVPIGVPGELHIGGVNLARGYLNRPDLTQEKFISNPFSDEPKARLYKTGDLARYLPDGNIEFLGRIDNQVKIRGFRIELGEIEAALSQHPDVLENAVIIHEVSKTDKRLIAYFVPNQEQTIKNTALRSFLSERLPHYMIPSTFVTLDTLPLTLNGKIDRRALSQLPVTSWKDSEKTFVAPRTSSEELLADIWAFVLGIKQVGVCDNFFELGGHSLLAVNLMTRIEQQFGKHLPLSALFQGPTIEQLALVIEQSTDKMWSSLIAIQPNGTKPPFFCVPGMGGNVTEFYELAQALGKEQPFYGLQAVGLNGKSKPYTKIEEMATHYKKEIQTVQPQGPYLLGGYSFGGLVAFEMSQQLHKQGHEVAQLVIFDMIAPHLFNKLKGSGWNEAKCLSNLAFLIKRRLGNVKVSYEMLQQPLESEGQLNELLALFKKASLLPPEAEFSHIRGLIEVYKANCRMDYKPTDIKPTRITLFKAHELIEGHEFFENKTEPTWGWSRYAAGSVDIQVVPGNHFTMMNQSHVQWLAEKLRGYLDKV